MDRVRKSRFLVAFGLLVALAVARATTLAHAAPNAKAPMIVVGGAAWCGYCKQLNARLSGEAALQPLVSKFRLVYVDLDDKQKAAQFAKSFQLEKVSYPTLVIAGPDGAPLAVVHGAPQGENLTRTIEQAWAQFEAKYPQEDASKIASKTSKRARKSSKDSDDESNAADKSGASEQRIAVRAARKLLRERKPAQAIEAVAEYLDEEKPSSELRGLMRGIEKEGGAAITAAMEKMKNSESVVVGAVALVKAERLYGKLPALKPEFEAGFETLSKAPSGEEAFRQAKAIDKGRALDEAGETESAMAVYRQVAADFADTRVAAMASARMRQLQK